MADRQPVEHEDIQGNFNRLIVDGERQTYFDENNNDVQNHRECKRYKWRWFCTGAFVALVSQVIGYSIYKCVDKCLQRAGLLK